MLQIFNKSCRGYSHIKNKKPCQDYSASYKDNERMIITCCDGHGGNTYVRSQIGSFLASTAIINVFNSFTHSDLRKINTQSIEDKIKLLILCEYNKLVERHLAKYPLKRSELLMLNEDEIETLKFNPEKAYGTTLAGALLLKNKLLVASIGDTEVLGIRHGQLVHIFDNSNDPVSNVTYSMCQEDAFKYLRVQLLDFKELDGIVLCTDGMSTPYQSYDNFNQSFIKPLMKRTIETKSLNYIDSYVEEVASKLGVGDDVSLSFIIKDHCREHYYK